MSGSEWDQELVDSVTAGDLNPNGVVMGLGAELPPPLNTYLISGIAFYSAGSVWGYQGVRFNGLNFITETGIVLADGVTIIPISYYVSPLVAPNVPGVKFIAPAVVFQDNVTRWVTDPLVSAEAYFGYDSGPGGAGIVNFTNTQIFLDTGTYILKNSNTPTLSITGGGAFAIGNSVLTGQEYCIGDLYICEFDFTFGGTANQGTGLWNWGGFKPLVGGGSLSKPVGEWYYVKTASVQRARGPILMSIGATTFQMQVGGGTPTLGAFTAVGQNLPDPAGWSVGDRIGARVIYRTTPF